MGHLSALYKSFLHSNGVDRSFFSLFRNMGKVKERESFILVPSGERFNIKHLCMTMRCLDINTPNAVMNGRNDF